MKKIFILFSFLLVLTQGLYADPDYYFVTNTVTQADLLDKVIDSINVFIDDDAAVNDTSHRYYNMLSFVVMLGVAAALLQLLMSFLSGNSAGGFRSYVAYLLTVVFVMILAFGPKAEVMVQTEYGSGYSIKKLPEIVAFTFGAFFTIKRELDELSQIAFDLPDPTDNTFKTGGGDGLGFVGGEAALSNMWKNATFSRYENGDYLSSMWSRFVRDCYLLPAASTVGGEQMLANGLSSTQLANDIMPTTTGFSSELITFSGETKECGTFWTNDLQPELLSFENNVTNSEKYVNLGSALGYFGAMIDDESALSSAGALKAAVTQAVLSNEFSTTYSAMGIAGEVYADGAAQATADVQMNGLSTGLYMAEQLPIMAFLVFLIMVAAFPFVIAFALLPGSLGVLVNYLRTLLWVSLWEPMGNILSMFFDYRFAQIATENDAWSTGFGEMAIAPSSLMNVGSEAASIAGIAGFLFVAVQGLSWILVTGSGQMIGNLMSNFGSAFNNRANADAQIATRTEMAAASMTSAEMGEMISMREQYAYNAMANAGALAGVTAGAMSSFGRDGFETGMQATHNSTVSNAMTHGSATGMSKEIGTGGNASRVAEINSSRDAGSKVTSANTFGTSTNAASAGSIEGGQNASTSMATRDAYNGSVSDANDVAGKKASLQAGTDQGSTSVLSSNEEAVNTGNNLGLLTGTQNVNDSKVVEGMTSRDLNNAANMKATTNIKNPADALNKTAKALNQSPEDAISTISDNTTTREAGSNIGLNAEHKAQGTTDDVLNNSATLGDYAGSKKDADAQRITEANRNGSSSKEMARTESELTIGKTDHLTRKGKELTAEADAAQEKASLATSDAQHLLESKQNYEKNISDYKEHIQKLHDVGKEIEELQSEKKELLKDGAPKSNIDAVSSEIEAKQAKANVLASQTGDIAKKAGVAYQELKFMGGDKGVKDSLSYTQGINTEAQKKQRDADVVTKIGETKATNEVTFSARVQGMSDRAGDRLVDVNQKNGAADYSKVEGHIDGAESTGKDLEEITYALGASRSVEQANEMKIAEQNAPAIQQRLRDLAGADQEKLQFLEKMGVFDKDPIRAMAAIKSLKNMQVKTTASGMEVSITNDESGDVRTQFISSIDGFSAQAKLDVDYAGVPAAKAISSQDTSSQMFFTAVKSIGQDAIEARFGKSFGKTAYRYTRRNIHKAEKREKESLEEGDSF